MARHVPYFMGAAAVGSEVYQGEYVGSSGGCHRQDGLGLIGLC